VTALRVLDLDFEVGGRRCGDRHFEIAEWQQLYDETELLGQSALMTDTANEIDTGICWREGAIEVDVTLVTRGRPAG
jgi:hypothetical protein